MIYLFTSYYKHSNPERQKELDFCLQKNVDNKSIHKIILFIEGSRPSFESDKFESFHGRPRYLDFVKFINSNTRFMSSYNIISNSDIYFGNSLQFLDKIDFHNKCLALTRHDVDFEGNIVKVPKERFAKSSQDAWIFKGSVLGSSMQKIYCDFQLGVYGCDNRFAFELNRGGYEILNPCLDIIIYHLHISGIRPKKEVFIEGPYLDVPICKNFKF